MATIYPYGVDAFQTYTQFVTRIDANLADDWRDAIQAVEQEEYRTYNPDVKPQTPSAYDDEFEIAALDPKWTPINCGPAVVDLLSVANAKDTYDATTYRGMMALQPGRDNGGAAGYEAEAAILRQTVALAANCKVIIKINAQQTFDTAGGAPPYGNFGVFLTGVAGFNDNEQAGVHVSHTYVAGPFTPIISKYAGGQCMVGGVPGGGPCLGVAGDIEYLMILKTGNDYSFWAGNGKGDWGAAIDGGAPDAIRFTNPNPLTQLSLFAYWGPPVPEVNLPNPIATFDFVRYFTNNTPLVNA